MEEYKVTEEIYKIKKLKLSELKQESPLDRWFYIMIQKKVENLSLEDISKMLRQNVFLDIAIPMAWIQLFSDPFCGEMYDGQLLETLIQTLKKKCKVDDYKNYQKFKKIVLEQIDKYEWSSLDDKLDYVNSLNKLELIFKQNRND